MKKNINKLVIFGTGAHAKICLNEFLKNFVIKKIYFFNNMNNQNEINILNRKFQIVKKYNDLKKKINNDTYFFLGIGDNLIRKKILNETAHNLGKLKWLKLVSRYAIIDKSVKIGIGTAVLPGAIINFQTKIGDHCILNTKCSIDHDCSLDSFVNVAPGVNIAGNVSIKKFARIGIGASIKEDIKIEENVIVGANSYVNKNCKKNCTYIGLPSKIFNKKKV